MAVLPYFNTPDRILTMLQNQWSSMLNPVLSQPLTKAVQLSDIKLSTGDNVINTLLGRQYQGYIVTGMRGAFSQIHEVPSANETINLTLNSSAACTVDLLVY